MMRFLRQWIMDSLGFSKTEANGTIVLILIIVSVAILPKVYLNYSTHHSYKFESDSLKMQAWSAELASALSLKEKKAKASKEEPKFENFKFNPNTASKENLLALGFNERSVSNLLNYRESGGQLKIKADLKRIYGISSSRVDELWQYIELPDELVLEEKLITTKKPETPKEEASTAPLPIFINTAEAYELMDIRGIGTKLSKRIIDYRDNLGGFQNANQLSEVYGLSEDVLTELNKRIVLDSRIRKINLNTDSLKHLTRHPYIDYNLAKVIFNYRSQIGGYDSVEQIRFIKIIDDSLYQKIYPYLSIFP